MEAFTRKLLSGSEKVIQVAACHQDGGRCTVPRADNRANQRSALHPKHCDNRSEITVHLRSWGPASLTVMVQVNMNNICLMAIWVSEEPIHSGPHAHPGQRQELRPQRGAGSLGWVLHPQQTPPGPAHLAPPYGGLWVSTDTCKWHTRLPPAAPAH